MFYIQVGSWRKRGIMSLFPLHKYRIGELAGTFPAVDFWDCRNRSSGAHMEMLGSIIQTFLVEIHENLLRSQKSFLVITSEDGHKENIPWEGVR